MEKIGIITLNGYYNLGNRLQNYALQEVLKSYNNNVETLLIESNSKANKDNIATKIKKVLLRPIVIIEKIKYELALEKNLLRENCLKEFSKRFINESNYLISENNIPQDKMNEFDFFVTGSDQVWNPYFTKGSSLYFLSFASIDKRIAYAPSFGISEIPEEFKKGFSSMINEIPHLSVREDDGAKIIKELTNRDAKVVADPTMLLTKKEWLSIASPAKNKPTNKILLTYFLGRAPKEAKAIINKYSKNDKLEVVNLAQLKHDKYFYTDPAEFLDYINAAELFVTDSFHGVVFSILLQTPFIVTNRESKTPAMESRIDTLLSKFDLESRHINQIKDDEIFDVDFKPTIPILEKERRIALEFLEKAILNKGKNDSEK